MAVMGGGGMKVEGVVWRGGMGGGQHQMVSRTWA